MPTKRAIQITLSESDKGVVTFRVKRLEDIKSDEGGESHGEFEKSSAEFAVYDSAVEAAMMELKNFGKKIKTQPVGELFA